ncbi:MAG: ATP-dependent DNA helicase [Halanaerobiales bacterium]|nr:ATP-dependent DNA helicase [Halanaerobiales bacterium]
MEQKKIIKISVRKLIEFVLRSGDLVSSFVGSSRALEGTKAHQAVQKAAQEGYNPEVMITYIVEDNDINLEIVGRIDGVIKSGGEVVIDEIKSITRSLEYIEEDNPYHWAQAKCYAFIYAQQNCIENIEIQLTYYQLETKKIKRINRSFSLEELKIYFYEIVNQYLQWARVIQDWEKVRNNSINQLNFPFTSYRKGQRKMAVAVYQTILEGKNLFAEAPTGIGKTIATLFPAIKAISEGHISKIFYLTAKTITRTIAEKAFTIMRENGLRCKTVTLTAKEKICFNSEVNCNPETCEFAKGHFDRVDDAIKDIFTQDAFTRSVIEEYAMKYKVCPFEFSLDLVFNSDCIICDYNYVFDPRVHLKRFFMDNTIESILLVDEAHNLVDRARSMFSAELFKKPILDLKRETKEVIPELSKKLHKINLYMIQLRKKCEEREERTIIEKELPKDIIPLLKSFTKLADSWLAKNIQSSFRAELLEIYYTVVVFLRISELYDEKYITYVEKIKNDIKLKIFCLDPSTLLKKALKRGKGGIFFSATLSPLDYFMELLGGSEDSYRIKLNSPFPRENLCLLIDDSVSTKFKMREFTYDRITETISVIVNEHKGNYLVFLPSYKYMNEIYNRFCEKDLKFNTICQTYGMSEKEREDFLKNFSVENEKPLVGFAVLGGIFGEGIDLTGERLTGVIIGGVGLPQICFERNILREYFLEKKGMGFEYAYIYPGINKILQAAGRVIRTEKDRGIVFLIDERYSYSAYRKLLPNYWYPLIKVRDNSQVVNRINQFFND